MIFRELQQTDINQIVSAFAAIGWDKPAAIYELYLAEQVSGQRKVLLAFHGAAFTGYVTVKWVSDYPGFAKDKQLGYMRTENTNAGHN